MIFHREKTSPTAEPSCSNSADKKRPASLKYVALTPACNEERYIEGTIQSMAAQTMLPQQWIIVDDGSTDGTPHIIERYSNKLSWLKSVAMPAHARRSFAAKAHCIKAAVQSIDSKDFELIACVDADVTFGGDFFETLIKKFANDPELGVAGTPFWENGRHSHSRFGTNFDDPPGQCQVFRKACFDDVGGYPPVVHGGEDTLATTFARMQGWKTKTFTEICFQHHRATNAEGRKMWSMFFHLGLRDGIFRNHPLWELLRIGRQMTLPPYLVRGGAYGCGYIRGMLGARCEYVSAEVIRYRRGEQLARLKKMLYGEPKH